MRTTTPLIIGAMRWPDRQPGGFYPPLTKSRAERERWPEQGHEEVIEQANRVLEKRMPSESADQTMRELM
jgi:hypothetical protein